MRSSAQGRRVITQPAVSLPPLRTAGPAQAQQQPPSLDAKKCTLDEALANGLVAIEVSVTGRSLNLTVRARSRSTLELTVPVGTVFIPADRTQQRVAIPHSVALPILRPESVTTARLSWVCIDQERRTPDGTYRPRPERAPDGLTNLLQALRHGNPDETQRQVWAYAQRVGGVVTIHRELRGAPAWLRFFIGSEG